ncbi:MAG: BolA family protein [Gammaproteobacteria bacterium]
MTEARVDRIRTTLESAFEPLELEIRDDGHLHAGHAGAKEGKGHFHVYIVSDRFQNTSPIDRHRMIFEALGEMMTTEIHALSVSAAAPNSNQKSSH